MQYVGQCYDERGKEAKGTQEPLNKRWQNGEGYKENEKFYPDICELGFDNFKKEILIQGINWDSSLIIERFMINYLDTYFNGYNNNTGGVGPVKGSKKTEETIAKMKLAKKSKARKGPIVCRNEKTGRIKVHNKQTDIPEDPEIRGSQSEASYYLDTNMVHKGWTFYTLKCYRNNGPYYKYSGQSTEGKKKEKKENVQKNLNQKN